RRPGRQPPRAASAGDLHRGRRLPARGRLTASRRRSRERPFAPPQERRRLKKIQSRMPRLSGGAACRLCLPAATALARHLQPPGSSNAFERTAQEIAMSKWLTGLAAVALASGAAFAAQNTAQEDTTDEVGQPTEQQDPTMPEDPTQADDPVMGEEQPPTESQYPDDQM